MTIGYGPPLQKLVMALHDMIDEGLVIPRNYRAMVEALCEPWEWPPEALELAYHLTHHRLAEDDCARRWRVLEEAARLANGA